MLIDDRLGSCYFDAHSKRLQKMSTLIGARRRGACDVTATAPKRQRKSYSKTPSKKRATQTVLDLGQKTFGRRAECTICGLLYVVCDAADEAAHARRCDAYRRGARAARLERADARKVADVGETARVVEVRPTDARSLRAVVVEVRRTAARDLGAPPDEEGERHTAYVAVERGRAVGLCLVEPIPTTNTLGVAALWVLASQRRRGLGAALVDAARQRFALAGPVPRADISTTHRTRDGAAFFEAYGAGRVYAPR